jgi:hypothetical protein
MKEFLTAGPFDIPHKKAAGGHCLYYKDFWDQTTDLKLIGEERGAYLFCIHAGKGFTPIYVGSATKSFRQECFNATNRNKYHEGLADYKKCRPVMFFIVHPKQKGKTNVKAIEEIETFLIQLASDKNPDGLNIKKTKGPRWSIKGVIRSRQGKPSESALQFRQAIGFKK